jgi:TatD DNase family protein
VTDAHAHLDALDDPGGAVERAREAGVTTVVTVGTGIDSCRRALALAERHAGVHAVLGIDPHQAGTHEAERLDELRELLTHPSAVGVGECGLDYVRGAERKVEQRRLFEAQLALATDLGRPVVVHTRGANADTAAMLASHRGTVVLHCFSEPHLLPAAQEHGWYVSFAGNATYPKATDLRLAASVVDETRLLAETDSPFLAPQPVRGRRNEPANVVLTLAELARVRGADPAELGRRIDANASAAFALGRAQ